MDVKLVILLCVASVGFASDFYNYSPIGYNPYYAVGGYPLETHEEYEYYDQSYGHAPVAVHSAAQSQRAHLGDYNARVASSAVLPAATSVASNVQVANVHAAQPAVVSTTPVPQTNFNIASYNQQPVASVVQPTVAPILAKSYQLGLVYPYLGLVPASIGNVADVSGVSLVNTQSVVNTIPTSPIFYSTTHSPFVASNRAGSGITSLSALNLPAFVGTRTNVVSVPQPNPSLNLNNVVSSGYNLFNQGSSYNSFPTLIKSNFPYVVSNAGNTGVYLSSIANQAVNNGNYYSSTQTKSNFPLQSPGGILNQGFYSTTANPLIQNVFGSGSSDLTQSQIFQGGNFGSSVRANTNLINSFSRVSQPLVGTVSPTVASNVISFSSTTPSPFNGYVPVTSTYSAIKKQTVYSSPITSQSSVYQNIGVNPVVVTSNAGVNSIPVSNISPYVFHNGSPAPVIYSTTPAAVVTSVPISTTTSIPIVTTVPVTTSSTQGSVSQVTTTPGPLILSSLKPSSTSIYTSNQASKVTTAPITTKSFYNYTSNAGAQSTTTVRPSTIENMVSKASVSIIPTTPTTNYVPSSFTPKPSTILVSNPTVSSTKQFSTLRYPSTTPISSITTSSATQTSYSTQKPAQPAVIYNNINKQNAFAASTTTYKPAVTNNYVSSSSGYNKSVQNKFTIPATYSTISYKSSLPAQKPTVSYTNNVNNAAFSGFSKASTYRPTVTNNYVSSSSTYNTGIQSTYTTPAPYSTISSTTQSKIAPPKPTVPYSTTNRQDAFTAALSGFSKPTSYRPSITNNYVSSIYDRRIQSTYTTPATFSTPTYTTQPTYSTQKPSLSFNTGKISNFSNPTTYRPIVTNNLSTSSIYNKGIQSTYSTPKPSVSYLNKQNAFSFSKSPTYKPYVTNNYYGSSSLYNKGIQNTYTTPVTSSTATYTTQSFANPTQKPTVTYSTFNKQNNAFTSALSGFSAPTTYKPSVTNGYASFSTSTIYNKGIQSTYTTPATYTGSTYTTQSSSSSQKPTVSYNIINNPNAFNAALSGFSKPTTYRTPVQNYAGSSTIYNKGSQSTYTTPGTYSTTYNIPSSVSTTSSPVTVSSINTGIVKTTSLPKLSSILSTSTQTGNVVANTQTSKASFSKPVFSTNFYSKNSGASNFNSLNKATNSVYQTKKTNVKYTPVSNSVNQFVPFVNIPASPSFSRTTVVAAQRNEFVPIVPNYQGTVNVVVQPPASSETVTTIVPSTLDYSSTYVTQSLPPPEAVSNFVHTKTYLPPAIAPAVFDADSNRIANLLSQTAITSTVTTPIVVETTPRTLPLSYESISEVKAAPYSEQVTAKPIVYTTEPVITKVDVSPALAPVTYSVPVDTVQVSTENTLS